MQKIVLGLEFSVLQPITNLPFYHGAQWSALLRYGWRELAGQKRSLYEAGIEIIPMGVGLTNFREGETIGLVLRAPFQETSHLLRLLDSLSELSSGWGHFVPEKTIVLEKVIDLVQGKEIPQVQPQPLEEKDLQKEINHLTKTKTCRLRFMTPFRLKRPVFDREPSHTYFDEEYFALEPFFEALAEKFSRPLSFHQNLEILERNLLWIDFHYDKNKRGGVSLGGIVGEVKIKGPFTRERAELLIKGQYTSISNNSTYGLGYYKIPELSQCRPLFPPPQGTTLLDRCLHPQVLKESLENLSHSSPGRDGVTVEDLRDGGEELLQVISDRVRKGEYSPTLPRPYTKKDKSGKKRTIYVPASTDRLLQKAAHLKLSPAVEKLLASSAFAYRRGRSIHTAADEVRKLIRDGYDWALRVDIASFFDTINTQRLWSLMKGLFAEDPLIVLMEKWLSPEHTGCETGLAQGSPLSPLLSNLYLTPFDQEMEARGFHLFRYGDDMVILFRPPQNPMALLNTLKDALKKYDLVLQSKKTEIVPPGKKIQYLGYTISAEDLNPPRHSKSREWYPLFQEKITQGLPVYLTTLIEGCHSTGPHLVLRKGKYEQKIKWQDISRLVVMGKARFSGRIIQRALYGGIPVSFLNIMGKPQGYLLSEERGPVDYTTQLEEKVKNKDFVLDYSREIVRAKLHNMKVTLRRRNIDIQEKIESIREKVLEAKDLESLRGFEGSGSRIYFENFGQLIDPFDWPGRKYHPPIGEVNALLSLGYTLIYHRLSEALMSKGFNPQLGLYHQPRGNHCALASDLMEEMRHFIDNMVLTMIRRNQIKKSDFTEGRKKGQKYHRLKSKAFRKFILQFEKAMDRDFTPQRDGKTTTYNRYLNKIPDKLRRTLILDIPYRPLYIH